MTKINKKDVDKMLQIILKLIAVIMLLIGVILFVLVSYLGKKMKKSWIIAIMLFVFIALLIYYAVFFLTLNQTVPDLATIQLTLIQTSGITLVFILISFFMYLWIDDIEAKMGKRKSIDNSMDWFWKNV